MTASALDEALRDLGRFITEELAATQVAIGCLRTVAYHALTIFEAEPDQQATRLLGTGVPGGGWIAPVHGIAGARALVADMAEGGPTHCRITQQWIVTVYTGWEVAFRRRIAAAHGIPEKAVTADFFGDLRHLRHDIVHHRGIATQDHGAKCCTILKRPLSPGDTIYLRDDELRQMHTLVPWATLLKARQP